MYRNYSTKLIALLTLLTFLLSGTACATSNSKVDPTPEHKGATTPLMQSIADNVPEVTVVNHDTVYTLAEGIRITEAQFTHTVKHSTMPQHIFIAEVDLPQGLTLVSSTRNDEPIFNSRATIPDQMAAAEKNGKKVLMGINGDFAGETAKGEIYTMNIFVKDGHVLKDTYAEDYEGLYVLLRSGECKIIHPREFAGIRNQVVEAMGGYQWLVREGQTNNDMPANYVTEQFAPRTFMGLSKDNKKAYLFVLDGRQPGYSMGMWVKDIPVIAKAAGCYTAMNLDGGGSSTIVIKDKKSGKFKILNKYSDPEPRPVINGLMVIKK